MTEHQARRNLNNKISIPKVILSHQTHGFNQCIWTLSSFSSLREAAFSARKEISLLHFARTFVGSWKVMPSVIDKSRHYRNQNDPQALLQLMQFQSLVYAYISSFALVLSGLSLLLVSSAYQRHSAYKGNPFSYAIR